MKFYLYPRVSPQELRQHARQHVARLRVGGGNRQPAEVAARILVTDLTQRANVAQHAASDRDHLLAGSGDRHQSLALAHEHIDAKLLLQQADLP